MAINQNLQQVTDAGSVTTNVIITPGLNSNNTDLTLEAKNVNANGKDVNINGATPTSSGAVDTVIYTDDFEDWTTGENPMPVGWTSCSFGGPTLPIPTRTTDSYSGTYACSATGTSGQSPATMCSPAITTILGKSYKFSLAVNPLTSDQGVVILPSDSNVFGMGNFYNTVTGLWEALNFENFQNYALSMDPRTPNAYGVVESIPIPANGSVMYAFLLAPMFDDPTLTVEYDVLRVIQVAPVANYDGGFVNLRGGAGIGTGVDKYVRIGNSGTPTIAMTRDSLFIKDNLEIQGTVKLPIIDSLGVNTLAANQITANNRLDVKGGSVFLDVVTQPTAGGSVDSPSIKAIARQTFDTGETIQNQWSFFSHEHGGGSNENDCKARWTYKASKNGTDYAEKTFFNWYSYGVDNPQIPSGMDIPFYWEMVVDPQSPAGATIGFGGLDINGNYSAEMGLTANWTYNQLSLIVTGDGGSYPGFGNQLVMGPGSSAPIGGIDYQHAPLNDFRLYLQGAGNGTSQLTAQNTDTTPLDVLFFQAQGGSTGDSITVEITDNNGARNVIVRQPGRTTEIYNNGGVGYSTNQAIGTAITADTYLLRNVVPLFGHETSDLVSPMVETHLSGGLGKELSYGFLGYNSSVDEFQVGGENQLGLMIGSGHVLQAIVKDEKYYAQMFSEGYLPNLNWTFNI